MLRRIILKGVVLLLPWSTGCAAPGGHTLVEGRMKPGHFKFAPVIEKTGAGAGGWRAACVHLRLARTTGESYLCIFGVEVPVATTQLGPVSIPRAQRVAADCANLAAQMAFGPTTDETPLGMACTGFIVEFNAVLQRALMGTRVTRYCRDEPRPVEAP